MGNIIQISCEYKSNPIGIDCAHPRLFWRLSSGAEQTAYRVVVCSSEEAARSGRGDCYDSGVVRSSRAFYAEYAGVPLRSRQRYWWKVCVYTAGGECAESEVGCFEMGLLSLQDWKGTWMSMPPKDNGATSLYRREIDVRDGALRARAYICGLGLHELYVNGKKVGNAVLNPSVTDYSKRVPYCTYDILPYLRTGKNGFGIELGGGWYGGKVVLAQICIDYPNGETAEYHSSVNGGWMVANGPTVNNSLYDGEVYDARLEEEIPKDWSSPAYQPTFARGWMQTVFCPPPAGTLEAQALEAETVAEVFPGKRLPSAESGRVVYDVGKNIAGWARIRVRGARGARVTLLYGERLKSDGSVDRCNLRSARASDVYILKGGATEEYAPRFTFHGFQYVQVLTEGTCEILSLQGELVHNATRCAGMFCCSDDVLNRLHDMAQITERNNEQGVLTDCPQRDERFGWLNDLSARLYQTVYNRGMERFFPKIARDITHTQLENGAIGDTAPFFTGSRPADPVSVAYLLIPAYAYIYYGDRRCAQEEYEGCRKWVEFLLSQTDGYIVNYSFYGDWVAPACYGVYTDGRFMSTACLYWQLRLLSFLASITDRKEDAAGYARHAQACADAINAKYFDAESCAYAGGTQTADSMALTLGIAPAEYRARLAEKVAKSVRAYGYHSTCGNVGYRHLFYVLGEYGYADEALRMLKNPEYPGWGFMLANGATSVWERWESEMSSEMDSFNHPMFGSYDAFFYHFLAGIRIEESAFACDRVTISPVFPAGIDFVRASFETVRGTIVSEWKRAGGKISLHVEIPNGITATIALAGEKTGCGCGSYDFTVPAQAHKTAAQSIRA